VSMTLQAPSAVRIRRRLAAPVAGLVAVAAVAGVAIASNPKIIVVAALAAAGVVAVAKPRIGIAVLWVTGLFYGVVLTLVHGNTTLTLWKDGLVALLFARTILSAEARQRIRSVPRIPLILLAAYAVFLFLGEVHDRYLGLVGLRITFEWVLLLYVSAAWVDWRSLRKGLAWLLPLVVFSVALAIWQTRVGTQGLLQQGYQYDLNVRNAGGFVRAFGASSFGAAFGHGMAVLALAYLALALAPLRAKDRWLGLAGSALAMTGVALSLSRTALVAAAIGAVAMVVMMKRPGVALPRRRLAVPALIIAALAVAIVANRGGSFVVQGFTGHDPSVQARLDRWAQIWHSDRPLVGDGPGAAGVSAAIVAAHRGLPPSVANQYVSDNYYVATLAQYGVVGLILLATFLILLGVRVRGSLRAGHHPPWLPLAGVGVVTYFVVAMVTVNVWEDIASAIFIWTVVGAALSTSDRTTATT
jgi:O-antigen ligase